MATYTVKKGDTLSAIAKQYGTTYQEIAKANGISDPNKIYAGQTLNIGGTAQTTAPKTTAPTPTAPAPTAATNTNTGFKYDPYTAPQEVTDMWNKVNSMEKPVEQESAWNAQFNDTLNKILNGEKFSYDLNGDALYQQYKDQYTTQGKLASMDVMGQAAAMNGGYGSSYGQTVGHQAYQGYLQQLNDRVPELYQLALSQYNQERQDLKDQASMLKSLVDRDHDLYRESVSDYYTDLDYYTGRADKLSDDAYTKWSDDTTMKYNLYSDEQERIATDKSDANELALSMLSMGLIPEADLLAKAGISSEAAQAIANKVKADEAAAQAVASAKGSSGSGGSGGSGDDESSGGTYSKVLWNATGTYDDQGNPVFRNSSGKTQAFGAGTNPYTGGIHKDAKTNGKYDSSKVFSNGYQPNNINGTKLKNSGMSTSITGKNQTVWEANGKYWLWRGDLNQYVEVDISDLD